MKIARNVKGMSKIILLFLLLVFFAIGALISYVWTMGFYAPAEFNVPSRPTIVIQSVEFNPQFATFVTVNVLNPSYSPGDAVVSRIEARTLDDNIFKIFDQVSPPLPFSLGIGKSQGFTCQWNWANYTGIKLPPSNGKNVEIHVVLSDDMGEIAVVAKPFVSIQVANATFNTADMTKFDVSVQNLATSVTYINISSITVNVSGNISASAITPRLPYGMAPGAPAVTFTVPWNWASYRNQTVVITVNTDQAYIGQLTTKTP